jgi:hypothetical protein
MVSCVVVVVFVFIFVFNTNIFPLLFESVVVQHVNSATSSRQLTSPLHAILDTRKERPGNQKHQPTDSQQQWFFQVEGTINRPSSHAGARHALFRFAADFSGIYPHDLNADTAFCARNWEGHEDRRLIDFAVVFRGEESAQQFVNSLANYVKLTEGQIFFCDNNDAGNPAKNRCWQLIQPYEPTVISPILEADYTGRNHGDVPPKDSPVVEVTFSSRRSDLSGDTAPTADVTLLSQGNPVFYFQRIEHMSTFDLADAESAHIFPSAKCSGVYEWLDNKDYNRLALSRDLHINFDGTGRGRGKRRKTARVLAFRPLRPCNGYKIIQLPNSPERVYEIPLAIVLNDKRKANAVLRRLGNNVEMKSSGSLITLVGPDLKVCYPTERRVCLKTEDMQCPNGTTEQVFVNKVPGVDDLGTCWSVRDGQSLEAAEVLEKCLLWNYDEARETWLSLG